MRTLTVFMLLARGVLVFLLPFGWVLIFPYERSDRRFLMPHGGGMPRWELLLLLLLLLL